MVFGKRGSTSNRDVYPTPQRMVGFPSDGGLVPSGVTGLTALGLSSVWRCLDILSNGVSQLEWREKRGTLELPASRLVVRPQAERTRREWTSLVVSTLALYDVCYLLKAGGDDSEGVPFGLWPIDPSLISPVSFDYFTLLPPAQFYLGGGGGSVIVDRDQLVILHRSPQPGVQDTLGGLIKLARITFAAAIAAEGYASRYWQAGGAPTTVLESDQRLIGTTATDIQDKWRESRQRGPDYVAVLEQGLKARDFGADPTTQSAVEARRELVADIGRYFGIGASLLNSPNQSSQTYSTTEAELLHLARFTLTNYIQAIEDAISDQLPGGRRMYMDTWQMYSGSFLSQAQAFQLLTGGKAVLDVNEVRERIGFAPAENPDELNPAPAPVPAGSTGGFGDGG